MLILGVILVVLSAFYPYSFLAILGTALIFWSTILFYITPEKHVPLVFLHPLASSNADNIERILSEFGLNEKGIYLPPRNLRDIESSVVFLPKRANGTLPMAEGITEKLFSKEKEGVLLTPPGFGLSQLLEKELNTSFTKVDFTYLKLHLPEIIIGELQIVDNIKLDLVGNLVTVEVTGSIFNEICRQAGKQPRSHAQVGCLLSSTFACVLAKAIGKPIVIQNETRNKKNTSMEFLVL
jgi:hypothetical protein